MATGPQYGDFYFPEETPVGAVQRVVTAVLARDFVSERTVDAAVFSLGCANRLRPDPELGPLVFKSRPRAATNEDHAVELASQLNAQLSASQDGKFAAHRDWAGILEKVLPLVLFILKQFAAS